MRQRSAKETAVICVAAVVIVGLLTIPFELAAQKGNSSDLAITAQEHTDLKLGDVSAQLDFLGEQNASLQKILKDVE